MNTCQPVDCGAPPRAYPVPVCNTTFGSSCKYTFGCGDGSTYPAVATCSASGQWEVKANCPKPPSPTPSPASEGMGWLYVQGICWIIGVLCCLVGMFSGAEIFIGFGCLGLTLASLIDNVRGIALLTDQ